MARGWRNDSSRRRRNWDLGFEYESRRRDMQHIIPLDGETDFDGWRKAARALVLNDIKPSDVTWSVAGDAPELFAPTALPLEPPHGTFNVSSKFVELAQIAILHRSPERFALLYRLLWRLRQQPRSARYRDRSRCRRTRRDGKGGAPRRAQDARLRPLPRNRPRAQIAFRRLVRAGTSHRRTGRAVLRAPVRRHAVVDPDAGSLRALGRPCRLDHAGRRQVRGADAGPPGGNLAQLLRVDLQPGAAEGGGDAQRDAEEVLAEPAGGLVD